MKHKHEDLKLSAVMYHLENKSSYANTCNIFKCSERSLKRWIDRYEEEEEIKRHNRPPVAYKMKKKHVDYALKLLKANEQLTMDELSKQLEDKFSDYSVTPQHLGEVIRDTNLTRKRTRRKHFPTERYKKPIEFKTEMDKFFKVVDKYDLDKIICIDETSIAFFMSLEYSRCKLGKRCILKTTDNKVFQKHTLVGAISSKGLISYTFYDKGGMTTERLIEFLETIVRNRKKYLIVLDNAPAHRSYLVRNTIENSGNELVYCVPYTPRTNPIENWFSQLKHYMKKDKTLTIPEVRGSIATAIAKVKPEHYLHYFQYAYRRNDLRTAAKKPSTLLRPPKTYKES
jgi:transposase